MHEIPRLIIVKIKKNSSNFIEYNFRNGLDIGTGPGQYLYFCN